MRAAAGMLVAAIVAATCPSFAQDRYGPRGADPQQDECPQGRLLRQQKYFPPQLTDCQVLEADTAEQNRRIRSRQAAPRPAPGTAPPGAYAPQPAPVAVQPAPPAARPAPVQPAAAPPLVDYEARLVGNWIISAKQDRFGDGGTFLAMTGNGGLVMAVRCIQKTLTIGFIIGGLDPKPITPREVYSFKFRVDQLPVVELAGVAIDDRLIQLDAPKALVATIRDGRETAVRMESPLGVSSTVVFSNLGAPKAFYDLSRECPLG